jgi:hypothetical protein
VASDIGNLPAEALLSLVCGDEWMRTLYLFSDANQQVPLDVSSATFEAGIYKTLGGELEGTVDIDDTNAAQGQLILSISELVSADLTPAQFAKDPTGEHWLVIRMATASGITQTILRARIVMTSGMPV